MKTLCGIVSPLLWAEVYAIGSRAGKPWILFAGVGLCNVLHLLLTLGLPAAPPKKKVVKLRDFATSAGSPVHSADSVGL